MSLPIRWRDCASFTIPGSEVDAESPGEYEERPTGDPDEAPGLHRDEEEVVVALQDHVASRLGIDQAFRRVPAVEPCPDAIGGHTSRDRTDAPVERGIARVRAPAHDAVDH